MSSKDVVSLPIADRIAAIWRIERIRGAKSLAVPLAALLVLLAAVSVVQPRFLTVRALTGFATDAAPMLMLVMGGSIVILIGCIDLSVATMASFAAVIFVQLHPALGDLALPVVVLVAAMLGAAQGYVHVKAQVPSFVVTFGMLGILYGVTHYLSNATAAPLDGPSLVIDFLGARGFGIPNAMLAVLATAAVLSAAFRWTRLGRDLYAIGASERAALLAGVKVLRIKMAAFAISSACASLAGLMLLAQTTYSSPAMANNYLLPAIVGVVVGGTAISGGIGGIGCALIGGLVAVMVRVGTVMVGLNPAFQNIVFGLVILVAVTLTIDRSKIGIIK